MCCYLWCLMGKVKQKTNARQEKKIEKKKKKNTCSQPLVLLTVQPLSLLTLPFAKGILWGTVCSGVNQRRNKHAHGLNTAERPITNLHRGTSQLFL